MEFPDKVYVSFIEEASYDEGGFLSIQDSPESAIEGNGPTRVATYTLEKVEQGLKTSQFSLTDAIDKNVVPPAAS